MATKAEPKLAVRTQADMDLVVEAEAIIVDVSTWTPCSQGKDEAAGQAAILILTR